MCSGPSYEALHPTHQQIETESHPQVGGIRTVVSQCSDQQQTIEYVALASAQVVDQAGHHRFHHLHYMGSLNTVHDSNPERSHIRRRGVRPQ